MTAEATAAVVNQLHPIAAAARAVDPEVVVGQAEETLPTTGVEGAGEVADDAGEAVAVVVAEIITAVAAAEAAPKVTIAATNHDDPTATKTAILNRLSLMTRN